MPSQRSADTAESKVDFVPSRSFSVALRVSSNLGVRIIRIQGARKRTVGFHLLD